MFPVFKKRSDVSFLPESEDLRKRGYVIGYTIGEGSFAQVKNGYSTLLKRRMAVKVIHLKKTPEDFKTIFLPRELEISVSLRHRNITRIYDVFYYRYRIYIMMEHASHGNLLDLLKAKGKQSEPVTKIMFIQMCKAIEYLHNNGIVHRDMKCENVLLTGKNIVKVSDFGFARYYTWGDLSKTYCGSTAYACPEVLKGTPYEPVIHDAWALGVILYISLNSKFPFDVSNVVRMCSEQAKNRITFLPELSEDCKALMRSILNYNLKLRFRIRDITQSAWYKKEDTIQTQKEDTIKTQNEDTIEPQNEDTMKTKSNDCHSEILDVVNISSAAAAAAKAATASSSSSGGS